MADDSVRYKFTVSYDGTLYWGFQRQKGHPTIQEELEKALAKLGWEESSIIGADGLTAEYMLMDRFTLRWNSLLLDCCNQLAFTVI